MNIYIETKRLILREILPEDEDGFYELDSNAEVHRFLGSKPSDSIEQTREAIQFIRQQYIDNGVGRLAIIEKSSNHFIGWTGLKLVKELTNNHINFYDLGYRLIQQAWGKGYATESAIASLQYGFEDLNLTEINAMADSLNVNSQNTLKKVGFDFVEPFESNGIKQNWYKIKKDQWLDVKRRHSPSYLSQ